jgi:colanic acid/amylovoran biosynthesis protein
LEIFVIIEILLTNIHSDRNAGDAALTQVTLQQLKQCFPDSRVRLVMDDPVMDDRVVGKSAGQTIRRRPAGPAVMDDRVIPSLFTWLQQAGADGKPRWRKRRLLGALPVTLIPLLVHRLTGRRALAFTPAGLRALVTATLAADLVVVKPGGFLYSSGLGLTLLISLYSMALALVAGKPLYVMPQSIGPFRRRWEQRITGWLLNRARLVMAREPLSLALLHEGGVAPARCRLMPDPAFAFAGAPGAAADEWLRRWDIDPQGDRPLLGMTAIHWGAENRDFDRQADYEAALAAAAEFFVRAYGGKVALFTQVWGPSASQDDRVPARRLAARLAAGQPAMAQAVRLIDQPAPPEILKTAYGRMDLFIGTRMHSNIFALSAGVPVIAIGYQHKTEGILQTLGLERWTIDIRQVNPARLQAMLAELWEARDSLRAHLRQILPGVVAQAGQAGALVAQSFESVRSGPVPR